MSINGYDSKYTDAGYDCSFNENSVNASYDVVPSGTSIAVGSSDLYTTTVQCGVYMINLSGGNYPINCSLSNLQVSGVPDRCDDGYIVYPGYAIQLFEGTSYSTSDSYSMIYLNNTTAPLLYSCNATAGNGESPSNPGFNTPNLNYMPFSTYTLDDPTYYSVNQTSSIYVWFRGQLISITGLS
jgi:hypothetical protein